MKRPTVIIFVLVFLALLVSLLQFGSRLKFLSSGEQGGNESPVEGQARIENSERKHGESHDIRQRVAESRSSGSPRQEAAVGDLGEPEAGSQPAVSSVKVADSQLYFVRSSQILDSSEPTEEEIAQLIVSVEKVAKELKGETIVIDADGLAESELPFLLFGRDDFDLTTSVRVVYEASFTVSERFGRTTDGEQGAAPQIRPRW